MEKSVTNPAGQKSVRIYVWNVVGVVVIQLFAAGAIPQITKSGRQSKITKSDGGPCPQVLRVF